MKHLLFDVKLIKRIYKNSGQPFGRIYNSKKTMNVEQKVSLGSQIKYPRIASLYNVLHVDTR